MSNIQKFDNDAAQQLLDLAAELGVDISDTSSYDSGTNSQYTNYVQPAKVRTVIKPYGQKTISWTVPGEKDLEEKLYYKTSDGQLVEWSEIKELGGIIVDYSQRDQLGYFDGEKTVTLCSVIGYGLPSNPVKDLPKTPYGNKYQWDKKKENGVEKNFINHERPNAIVETLGLIGNRSGRPTSCAECIRSGMSTEERVNEKGELKTHECEARAKLHMAVYEFTKINLRKTKGGEPQEVKETKHVSELYTLDDDGEGVPLGGPVLLQFNMTKSSIQGRYNKDPEKSIVGYEGFVRNLEYTFKGVNARRKPMFNYTLLRMMQNPNAPTFQTHFELVGNPSIEDVREAATLWKVSTPVRTVTSLAIDNLPTLVQSNTTTHQLRSANVDDTSATEVDVTVIEEISVDDIPF